MVLLMSALFGFHGIIENDTTWSDTAYLTGDVLVEEGITLIIDPGTVVLYGDTCEWDLDYREYPYAKNEQIDLYMKGNLKAKGLQDDSILFRPVSDKWNLIGNIVLENAWDSLDYVSVTGVAFGKTEMYLLGTNAVISNCLFEKFDGIVSTESEVIVDRCVFSSIGSGRGIELEKGSLSVDSCQFEDIHGVQSHNYYDFPWQFLGAVIGVVDAEACFINNTEILSVSGGSYADGVIVYGSGVAGIAVKKCREVQIENCTLEGIVGGEGDDSHFGFPPGSGGDGHAIYLMNCEKTMILHNKISDIVGGQGGSSEGGERAPNGGSYPIYICNSNPLIAKNEFYDEWRLMPRYIYIDSFSQPTIGGSLEHGNSFFDAAERGRYVIYNNSPFDIDATYNYWETGLDMIDSLIFDHYDDPTKGIVHYDHATDVEEKPETAPQALVIKSNLVGDILHVSFAGSLSQRAKLELFDASGRKILSQAIAEPQTAINVSDLPRGVYFVSARIGESERLVRKVIIY